MFQQRRVAPNNNVNSNAGTNSSVSNVRIYELLDSARGEFENVLQQMSVLKNERDEYERQMSAQLQEVEQMQHTLKGVEASHRRIRQQYEEEIARLRRAVDGSDSKMNKRMRVEDATSGGKPRGAGLLSGSHTNSGRSSPMRPNVTSAGNTTTTSAPSTNVLPNARQMGLGNRGNSDVRRISPAGNVHGSSNAMHSLNVSGGHNAANNVMDSAMGANNTTNSGVNNTMNNGTNNSMSNSMNNGANNSMNNGANNATNTTTNNEGKEELPPNLVKQEGEYSGEDRSEEKDASIPLNAESNEEGPRNKVKWVISYNQKPGVYSETERPHVEMQHTLDHQSVVCCVRFSGDGSMVASGCHKTAQIFDVESGKQIFSVTKPPAKPTGATNEAEDAYVRAVCFSPDGKKIVAGMPQQTIRIWDIETREEGLNLLGHESEIYSLDYVNNLIASGSGDRKVRLWDATTGKCRSIFGNEKNGPSDGVTSVAISPDGRLLAAASLDKVVRIWDTSTSQLLDRLEGHSDSVYSIAFSPDGKNIISGSLDRSLMIWDVSASGATTTRPRLLYQGHKDFVLSVAYTPDGRYVLYISCSLYILNLH